ncbi:MAG: alpha-1,4-glucan--maltose-1-phosphate maltosyltransferase [Terrimicrobiaceae bacterium]
MAEPPREAATAVISHIEPSIEGGRYPVKRLAGEFLEVSADVFKDGHDVMRAMIQWQPQGATLWNETPMTPGVNDRWSGRIVLPDEGLWLYRILAWGDPYFSWLDEVVKKCAAGLEDLRSEALEGAAFVEAAAARASAEDAVLLATHAQTLRTASAAELATLGADETLQALMEVYADRSLATASTPLRVQVERTRAGYAAWYEFFPRSAEGLPDRGSKFRDCLGRVDDARAMGFDVIYFPPIHPIGVTKRKGRNNSLTCEPGEPGVPYAIGNRGQGVNGGGHKDVAPELGTLEDFRWLVGEIRSRGMEVALDFAINCSPDHPYVHEHPGWFFKRPDGSIKYAENPPKKYEDVFPLNFHNPDWRNLWRELHSVVAFWCEQGVRIFRVDNPHTKPVAFWEWLIAEVRRDYPDAVFLSEAFTRPKMMEVLAKAGFTQSYTYFTWRNSRSELEEYLTELTATERKDFFRPNFFTNTPDILPEFLQNGGRPAFCIRAVLAATLSPLYGIYSGFELCENAAVPGKEEYLDSEKYQFKGRDWNAPGNIKELITKLNTIRSENRAFRELANLRFHSSDNPNILFYSKITAAGDNLIFVAVTHDPYQPQAGYVTVPLEELGLSPSTSYEMEDLLSGEKFLWTGSRNFVALNPGSRVAHIFRLRRPAGRFRGRPVFA